MVAVTTMVQDPSEESGMKSGKAGASCHQTARINDPPAHRPAMPSAARNPNSQAPVTGSAI